MKMLIVNYILVILMIILGIIVLITGLKLWFSAPGSEVKDSEKLKGKIEKFKDNFELKRKNLKNLHLCTALTLFSICIIHLILNFKWVIVSSKKIFSKKS